MATTKRPTKVPSFNTKLPSKIDQGLRDHINALTEALDVRLGRRGDPVDRAITLRELIESGMAVELRNTPFDPNNISKPTFGPPQVFPDVSTPPAPTGVSATGGYSLITVFWDFPLYSNHSQTEIWRYTSDSIGDAILVGTSGGRSFVDAVGQSADYYYWVRHVSSSDVRGPFHDTNGEHATTATDVATLLSVLSGAITTSQLVTALNNRINLIDGSAGTPGTIPYQIAQEAATRSAAISAEAVSRATAIASEAATRTAAINASASVLQSQINDLLTVQPYDNAETYASGDLVTYSGNLYRALGATTGNLPTNVTYWELMGAYSSLSEAVSDALAAIVELNNVSATSTSANASALYALTASVENPSDGLAATRALLISDYYTSADTDTAIASATSVLVSSSALTSALSAYTTTASLTTNYYTQTQTNSAISSAVSSLVSTTALNSALSAYTTTASLTSNYYTRTATDGAIAAALTTYISATALNTALTAYTTTADLTTNYYTQTQTNNAIAGALTTYATTASVTSALSAYTTTASLTSNYYTASATDSAIAAALTTYVSTTALNSALTAYTNTATLTANYYTQTQTNSAISAATSSLVSSSALTTALSAYTTTASLTTNYYTKTQTDSAISSSLTTYVSTATLTSTLGSYALAAAIEASYYTIASAELLEAQYFVKLNVNGRVSGFGLYSDSVGSEFIILADRFAIVSPYSNAVTAVPFIVQATSTTIGGVSVPAGVYINDAFIMNGTIVNAKIANAAIDDAKIASLSANKITTGTLDTSRLNIDGSTLVSVAGVLMLGNVYVDNLVAGSVTTSKLVGAAVNNVVTSEVMTSNSLPTNATYENVDSVNVVKEIADSTLIVDFQLEATCTGSGNYALYVYVKVDGTIQSRLFSFFMTKSFASTVQGRAVIVGLSVGTKAVQLAVQANVSGSGVSTATVNSSTVIVTEVKR